MKIDLKQKEKNYILRWLTPPLIFQKKKKKMKIKILGGRDRKIY